MSRTLEGARILITGAASGIGAAAAERLAARPVSGLILVDRDGAGLDRVASGLPANATCHCFDVADAAAWEGLEASGQLEGLTHSVISAGRSAASAITDMAFGDWRDVMSVNLDGAFLALRASLRQIADGGAVVALASTTARKAVPATAAYGASKAGLVQLVRTAALEMAPRGVRVNALAPGGVKTPMFSGQDFFRSMAEEAGSDAAAWRALAAATPLGRFAEPGEVAEMVDWLLAPETALVTGAVIDMDGGYGI